MWNINFIKYCKLIYARVLAKKYKESEISKFYKRFWSFCALCFFFFLILMWFLENERIFISILLIKKNLIYLKKNANVFLIDQKTCQRNDEIRLWIKQVMMSDDESRGWILFDIVQLKHFNNVTILSHVSFVGLLLEKLLLQVKKCWHKKVYWIEILPNFLIKLSKFVSLFIIHIIMYNKLVKYS
jgi:hypothetical protein